MSMMKMTKEGGFFTGLSLFNSTWVAANKQATFKLEQLVLNHFCFCEKRFNNIKKLEIPDICLLEATDAGIPPRVVILSRHIQ